MITAENTAFHDGDFWSSTGSADAGGSETLCYQLCGPLCLVRYVQLAVYRAMYQHG